MAGAGRAFAGQCGYVSVQLVLVLVLVLCGLACLAVALPLARPVVVLPGFLGSALFASIDSHGADVAPYCRRVLAEAGLAQAGAKGEGGGDEDVMYRVWPYGGGSATTPASATNSSSALLQGCVADLLALGFSARHGMHAPRAGVTVATAATHGPEALAMLPPNAQFMKHLLLLGYQPGTNLFVVPYDFRLPLSELLAASSPLASRLRRVIEGAGERVHVIAHGEGGPLFTGFLRTLGSGPQQALWLSRHVASLIGLGAAWHGALPALRYLVGTGSPVLLADVHKDTALLRTWGGISGMLPLRPLDAVLVSSPEQNFTVQTGELLLRDLNLPPHHAEIFSKARASSIDLEAPPPVDMYCFYGTGTATDTLYRHASVFELNQPPLATETADGDGLYPASHYTTCEVWRRKLHPRFVFHSVPFPGVDHMNLVGSGAVLVALKAALTTPRYLY